jgi:hypothetical protein
LKKQSHKKGKKKKEKEKKKITCILDGSSTKVNQGA